MDEFITALRFKKKIARRVRGRERGVLITSSSTALLAHCFSSTTTPFRQVYRSVHVLCLSPSLLFSLGCQTRIGLEVLLKTPSELFLLSPCFNATACNNNFHRRANSLVGRAQHCVVYVFFLVSTCIKRRYVTHIEKFTKRY